MCLFESLQQTNGGHYSSIALMTHLCALCQVILYSLSFSSHRAALWLPHEGVAVFLQLCGASVGPPLLHLPVACCGGRGPGEDVAEGDLPQEALLWVQGELRQQHQLLTGAETLVQKAHEGH